jgi:hypothetical protein
MNPLRYLLRCPLHHLLLRARRPAPPGPDVPPVGGSASATLTQAYPVLARRVLGLRDR